jgi:hypothetical protein
MGTDLEQVGTLWNALEQAEIKVFGMLSSPCNGPRAFLGRSNNRSIALIFIVCYYY